MAGEIQVVQTPQGWFVESGSGSAGPFQEHQEAVEFSQLLRLAAAARTETVCADNECFV